MSMSVVPVGESVPEGAPEPEWHISTYSNSGGGGCVEAGPTAAGERIVVRHSKIPEGTAIAFDRTAWDQFLAGVRDGQFDF